MSTKRNKVLKETLKERDIRICQKLSALIVVNMDILHKIAQKHVITLILLKKVSKTTKLRNMQDLDNTSVCEECVMMCTE